MDNFQKILEEQYFKTTKFRNEVNKIIKTNPNVGEKTIKYNAVKYGEEMKRFLRAEILTAVSDTTGEAFLDHILFDTKFINGIGWTVNVYFDEEVVTRQSFYGKSVYLPTLLNNKWSANPKGKARGYDRHGNYRYASDKYMSDYNGFIQNAVNLFKKYHPECLVTFSNKYDNGTY